MDSRRIKHAGQFAFPLQPDIAKQGGRALGELFQESSHALFDLGPVLDPAVHLENIVAQPAPQFLNRIEPRGIGWQPDGLEAGGLCQGGQYVRMRVNIPVILDHIDQFHRWGIGLIENPIELTDLVLAYDVAIKVVHLPGQGIEGADGTPLLIVPRPLLLLMLAPPPANADSQTHPETARPRCPDDAPHRADSGAASAPSSCSRDQD